MLYQVILKWNRDHGISWQSESAKIDIPISHQVSKGILRSYRG